MDVDLDVNAVHCRSGAEAIGASRRLGVDSSAVADRPSQAAVWENRTLVALGAPVAIRRGFSVREVIESARRVTGHPIPAEIHPRRSGDPAALVASSEKAIRELGWKPRYTQLDEILRTAWVWHRKLYAQ